VKRTRLMRNAEVRKLIWDKEVKNEDTDSNV
jgi:hypothetical protein